VRGALGAVDDLQLAEGEFEVRGEGFDAVLERAGFEGRELVEDGDNDDRVDCDGEELHSQGEGPEVEEELVAGLLDDFEEGGAQGDAEGEREALCFEHVADPEGEGLLVEAEGLFEDEVIVVAEGQGEDGLGERVGEAEEQTLGDFALEARREVAVHPEAGDGPEFRVDVVADGGIVLDLVPEVVDKRVLRFGAAVGLRLVEGFLVDFLLELLGDGLALEDLVLAVLEVGFDGVFAHCEGDDERFPWDAWRVQAGAEAS